MNKTVIVVGAGASGLAAARKLCGNGFSVTVIESRKEAGGRIRTERLSDGIVIEQGAEFIHGRLPLTLAICREAGIEVVPVEGEMYRKICNQWVEQEGMFDHWDEMLEKMKSVQQDLTLDDFLSEYFGSKKFAEFRNQIRSYAEGFDLADPANVSTKYLYEEWSGEDEVNFHIPSGYQSLIAFLEKQCLEGGCRFLKGDAVRQIDWQPGHVSVFTLSGQKMEADSVLITVPPGVLTDPSGPSAIRFTPQLDDRLRAFAHIGYGTVIKFVMMFRTPCWKPDTRFIFSDEEIPTWWTQLPSPAPVLTGWLGGPKAAQLSGKPESELLDIAIGSLAGIFDRTPHDIYNNIEQTFVFDWLPDVNARGAYSYATPQTGLAKTFLAAPSDDTVYFAGEALYNGLFPGTVEAALASGESAADRIIFPD